MDLMAGEEGGLIMDSLDSKAIVFQIRVQASLILKIT
jgi:hypothetical protein